MAKIKITVDNYQPLNGFYDLRAFGIPKIDFSKLARVQQFLFHCEQNRRKGKYKHDSNGLEKIKNFSAQYQQVLFSFPVIKPELI